jgi:hypothetical protein
LPHRFRAAVTGAGLLDHADIDALDAHVMDTIEAASAAARAAARPTAEDVLADVYISLLIAGDTTMTKMMYRDAVLSTIMEEMARDPDVVVLGEDVVGGMGTRADPKRSAGSGPPPPGFTIASADPVIDTPISESAIVGAAAGLALSGKRPVAELMFADFIGVCLDQLWNQIAKFRYMFGGKSRCPAVIRMAYGAGSTPPRSTASRSTRS